MTMCAAGVAKLIEECGELQQVCGKRLAYWSTDDHPDGTNLRERMQEEMGDVYAAIEFVTFHLGLDHEAIARRMRTKRDLFDTWQAQIDNNDYAIDGRPRRTQRDHRHFCLVCSDGTSPGPGCINCRQTGMDQTPCLQCEVSP